MPCDPSSQQPIFSSNNNNLSSSSNVKETQYVNKYLTKLDVTSEVFYFLKGIVTPKDSYKNILRYNSCILTHLGFRINKP
jgi:hypothetical protein